MPRMTLVGVSIELWYQDKTDEELAKMGKKRGERCTVFAVRSSPGVRGLTGKEAVGYGTTRAVAESIAGETFPVEAIVDLDGRVEYGEPRITCTDVVVIRSENGNSGIRTAGATNSGNGAAARAPNAAVAAGAAVGRTL